MKDLIGQRFGRLVVIKIAEPIHCTFKRKYWLCKCDCGNESIVGSSYLIRGATKSCGCLRKEISSKNGKKRKNSKLLDKDKVMIGVRKRCISGTSITSLSKTIPSNNTSGVKGVYWVKSRSKWGAKIEFRKKVYYLGRYDKKEDAIKARKQAEEKLFDPFLEWYNEWKMNQKLEKGSKNA